MPTTIAPAVNLQAGVVTPAAPPTFSDVGNAVVACVIFNYSSSVLTVTGTFGQKFLGPLTADLFDCPGIQGTPSLSPTTITAANTYIGIAQAVFYYAGDGLPTTYPQPLVAFPGGSTTIVNGIAIPTSPSLPFILPPGASVVTVTNFFNPGRTLTLTGVQSGTTYTQNFGVNGITTFTIIPVLDTSYTLTESGGGTGTGNVTASPGTPVPTFPTSQVNKTNPFSSTIIAAPSTGANYLFGWDGVNGSGAAAVLRLESPGGTIIALTTLLSDATSNGFAGALLGPYRTTGAVVATATGNNAGDQITVRYAPGP